ncbi:hypothetical protein AB1Y20_019738 [Prymnesium parvum]|uniref:G-protein coupled receptors family 3 profile domain-containing protein n=1 Tax=Prymnesium parvum TaxID=97485 RepID=A0AB34JVB2_PRYPA
MIALLPFSLAAPSEVYLGALFPMFRTQNANFGIDSSGIRRFASFYMAIKEINDKTDGVEDWLLPNTQLKYALRDSKRDDSSAFFGALALTREVFGGKGVSGIIGAASSGPTASAAIVTSRSQTPQISYSASSPLLSSGKTYSYFLRTVPSDAFQSEAIVDILYELFEYTTVSTIASTDSYGSAGMAAFLSAAASHNPPIAVLTSQNFANDATDFTEQMSSLKNVDSRVVVIFCQGSDSGAVLSAAYDAGVAGPGFLWFGSDAVTIDSTWLNPKANMELEERRVAIMKGFFGLNPSAGSSTFDSYFARLNARPSTVGNGAGSCNTETDDEGTYIWQQDHDNDATTPNACSGFDFQSPDTYAPFAYDATYAMARALHQLIEVEGKSTVVGSELWAALLGKVNFEGVTGTVAFNDASDHPDLEYHGDRRIGVQYKLFNYQSFTQGLVVVGTWSSRGGNSTWAERFTKATASDGTEVALVFSTDDNSKPIVPVPAHSLNLVPAAIYTMAIMLSLVSIVFSVLFSIWTIWKRNHPVLKASQPNFLLLVAIGCAISLAAIFPMAKDHADYAKYNKVDDALTGPGHYPDLDSACNMQIWFYCAGFAITYGALFVKLWRIKKIYLNPAKRVVITQPQMFARVLLLLLIECGLCLLISIHTPMHYEVSVVSSNAQNIVTESRGQCVADSKIWLYFAAIIALQGSFLIYGNWLVYAMRAVPSEFNEGKFIGFSLANNMQTTLIAVLLCFMTYDSPTIFFIMRWIAVFLVETCTLMLMFIPKIYAVHFPNWGRNSTMAAVNEMRKNASPGPSPGPRCLRVNAKIAPTSSRSNSVASVDEPPPKPNPVNAGALQLRADELKILTDTSLLMQEEAGSWTSDLAKLMTLDADRPVKSLMQDISQLLVEGLRLRRLREEVTKVPVRDQAGAPISGVDKDAMDSMVSQVPKERAIAVDPM